MGKYSEAVENLAAQMGVHPADVLMLAQSVANSIEKDKADAAFIAASDEARGMIAGAYVPHAVRKFDQFVSTYLTRNGAQEAFAKAVLHAI